jgi:homoserine dehydrogenase
VLLGARMTPRTVEREGITPASAARATAARAGRRRLKLVATAAKHDGAVTAAVGLRELRQDDVLAGLEGQQNALVIQTDLLGEIAVVQRGSGLTQTAYALLSDLITVAREVTGDSAEFRRAPL